MRHLARRRCGGRALYLDRCRYGPRKGGCAKSTVDILEFYGVTRVCLAVILVASTKRTEL